MNEKDVKRILREMKIINEKEIKRILREMMHEYESGLNAWILENSLEWGLARYKTYQARIDKMLQATPTDKQENLDTVEPAQAQAEPTSGPGWTRSR